MSYIEDLISGKIQPHGEQITLDEYFLESLYITKFMSPQITATNIATYHALFYLSYGMTGIGNLSIPWPQIGAMCCNERGDGQITKNEAVRSRTKTLVDLKCMEISRNRVGANDFYIYRPSEIDFVKTAISKEAVEQAPQTKKVKVNSYNDISRRLKLLKRESYKCAYCLKDICKESFYIDHILPRAKAGSNYKNNLLATCENCNAQKSDIDVYDFLLSNYRKGLLTQEEYIKQKEYINNISGGHDTGEP